jgi:penicillin amidase
MHPFVSRFLWFFVIPVAIISVVLWRTIQTSLPPDHVQVQIDNSVLTLDRDRQGKVVIAGGTDLAAFYGIGMAHAQDRLWQMEMARRTASGRLSEVFGDTTLASDKLFRTLGLYRHAQRIAARLPAQDRLVLQRYADGVNQTIASTTWLSPEFWYYRIRPSRWTIEDSVAIQLYMAWKLSTNFSSELTRMRFTQLLGCEKSAMLLGDAHCDPAQSALLAKGRTDLSHLELIEEQRSRIIGSNSWVVGPGLTQHGGALLANDPHLALSTPALWYLARIQGDKLWVEGATMPGLPYVVIGRNRHIAWGMTTLMADTQDVVLESEDPIDVRRYLAGGGSDAFDISTESIALAQPLLLPAKPALEWVVRRTRNGPLLSDLLGPAGGHAYSLRWTGDDEDGGTISAYRGLNYAPDWPAFNEALRSFVAPAHNFLFADMKGNIGQLASGRIPLRRQGDGAMPVIDAGQDAWRGWIPFEEMPRQFNPPVGMIVSANHRIVSDGYPYHISQEWDPGYRAQKITETLQAKIRAGQRIGVADAMALQNDVQSTCCQAFVELLKNAAKSPEVLPGARLIAGWDARMSVDSAAATLVMSTYSHFIKAAADMVIGRAPITEQQRKELIGRMEGQNDEFLNRFLSNYCVAGTGPDMCRTLARNALNNAINELSNRYGRAAEDWRWGDIHRAQYPHFPFSNPDLNPFMPSPAPTPLGVLFHRAYQAGGSATTVQVVSVSFNERNKYAAFFGAVYKQVVEMGPGGIALYGLPTGQSGNLFSKHYDDLAYPYGHGSLTGFGNE